MFLVKSQKGSAILIALVVVAVSSMLITYLLKFSLTKYHHLYKNNHKTSALYIAESGIAHGLYVDQLTETLNNSIQPIDSLNGIQKEFEDNETKKNYENELNFKSFKFFLSPTLPKPIVESNFEGEYLSINSTCQYFKERVTVTARFGRAIVDSIFTSALVLTSESPPQDISNSNIKGDIRLKTTPVNSMYDVFLLNKKFSIFELVNEYVTSRSFYYSNKLKKKLSQDNGELGNGYYNDSHIPDFSNNSEIFYPLGDITLEGLGSDCLVLNGPGSLFAHGDIYIKGCVKFNNIKLFARRSIQFEDNITSKNLTVYSKKNIYFRGTGFFDVNAIAEESIFLKEDVKTSLSSIFISVGIIAKLDKLGGETPEGVISPIDHGIYSSENALLNGFCIAAGKKGTVILENDRHAAEGIYIARKKIWLAGEVKGLVIANTLRCNNNSEDNCIGNGTINRELLSPAFALPLEFKIPGAKPKYKVISWKIES